MIKLIIRSGIMSGCITNFYILFHISLIFFSSAHSLHNDLDFERAHMVKTTGEFFTQQEKTQKVLRRKEVLYDTISNAFITVRFLA